MQFLRLVWPRSDQRVNIPPHPPLICKIHHQPTKAHMPLSILQDEAALLQKELEVIGVERSTQAGGVGCNGSDLLLLLSLVLSI